MDRKKKAHSMKKGRLRLYGAGVLFLCCFAALIVVDMNTVYGSFRALAVALKTGDQKQVERLCTPEGFKALHGVTARYGEYQLGDYLEGEKYETFQPSSNIIDIKVHLNDLEEDSRWNPNSKPAIFMMKRVWLRWKLGGISPGGISPGGISPGGISLGGINSKVVPYPILPGKRLGPSPFPSPVVKISTPSAVYQCRSHSSIQKSVFICG